MTNQNNLPAQRTYVVVEPDPVTCLDLVTMISSAFHQRQVSAVQSLSDAARLVSAMRDQMTVLVNGTLLDGGGIDILSNIAAQGARVVVIGKDIRTDFPKAVVEVPFTTEMILTALKNDGADAPESPLEAHTRKPA